MLQFGECGLDSERTSRTCLRNLGSTLQRDVHPSVASGPVPDVEKCIPDNLHIARTTKEADWPPASCSVSSKGRI